MENKLTMKDLKHSMRVVNENTPCTCNPGHDFYCHKHGIVGISKELADAYKKLIEDMGR